MSKKTKYLVIILIFVCLSVVFGIILPYISKQNEFISYKLSNKKIVKIEYSIYEGEPFTSIINLKKTIASPNKVITEFKKELNKTNNIILYSHPKYTSKVIFIYFDDKSMINAFIFKDKLGFNYGKVWVKNTKIQLLLEQMEEEALISE